MKIPPNHKPRFTYTQLSRWKSITVRDTARVAAECSSGVDWRGSSKTRILEVFASGKGSGYAIDSPKFEFLMDRLATYCRVQRNVFDAGFENILKGRGPVPAPAPPQESAGEHIVQLNFQDKSELLRWLRAPNGALPLPRVTFEAVQGGGILVRTKRYEAPKTPSYPFPRD